MGFIENKSLYFPQSFAFKLVKELSGAILQTLSSERSEKRIIGIDQISAPFAPPSN